MKLRPIFKIYLLLGFSSKSLEISQICSLAPYLSPCEAFFVYFKPIENYRLKKKKTKPKLGLFLTKMHVKFQFFRYKN